MLPPSGSAPSSQRGTIANMHRLHYRSLVWESRRMVRRIFAALAVALMAGPASAQVVQTGSVFHDGTWQSPTPTTIYNQACNGGAGGIVGQGSCTAGSSGAIVTTGVTGQTKVAVTGTAVQFTTTPPNPAFVNGTQYCALTTNTSAITVGFSSSLTATADGTGNGEVLPPGACNSKASPPNALWLNGTAGNGLSYGGN